MAGKHTAGSSKRVHVFSLQTGRKEHGELEEDGGAQQQAAQVTLPPKPPHKALPAAAGDQVFKYQSPLGGILI